MDEMEYMVRADPEKMKLRKCLTEHPFGTIKHHMDQGIFLMKGLENVNAEQLVIRSSPSENARSARSDERDSAPVGNAWLRESLRPPPDWEIPRGRA